MSPLQLNTTSQALKEGKSLYWRRFEGLNTTKHILVPLDFNYHPVDYHTLRRLPVCPMNISGMAAHQNKEAALISGLLELCEHEALMVTWFSQRTTPTVEATSLKSIHQEQVKSLRKIGWQVFIKDISLDLTPTVMVVALGPKGKRALTIGSCSAFSLQYAAGKALSEVIRTVLHDEIEPTALVSISKTAVNDTLTHSLYYAQPENLKEIAWLWEGGGEIVATDTLTHGKSKGKQLQGVYGKALPTVELRYLTEDVFTPAGIGLYWCDMTPLPVKKEGIPLVVVRTLAPEMTRFVAGYNQGASSDQSVREISCDVWW